MMPLDDQFNELLIELYDSEGKKKVVFRRRKTHHVTSRVGKHDKVVATITFEEIEEEKDEQ